MENNPRLHTSDEFSAWPAAEVKAVSSDFGFEVAFDSLRKLVDRLRGRKSKTHQPKQKKSPCNAALGL